MRFLYSRKKFQRVLNFIVTTCKRITLHKLRAHLHIIVFHEATVVLPLTLKVLHSVGTSAVVLAKWLVQVHTDPGTFQASDRSEELHLSPAASWLDLTARARSENISSVCRGAGFVIIGGIVDLFL